MTELVVSMLNPYLVEMCTCGVERLNDKNAFQWDAYRPLVDHIPACTVARFEMYRGVYLPGVPAQGIPARGVYLPWGVLYLPRGVYLPGVYLPGGLQYLPRGVYLPEGTCPGIPLPLRTDRHL